jgi:S-formylglutathione hydrolase FrmB
MALKRPLRTPGTVLVLEHESKVLADNPLGDPHVRRLAVWLPPQPPSRSRRPRRLPVLFDLAGFTGSGLAHLNWKPFSENVAERAARLLAERKIGPVILVFPDCFTRLGGNQYVNSSAIGRYADYLTRELVPFVDREFPTLASREHRGCFGKSSGGYGALIHGMKYARHWGAIASHSGDAGFDLVYRFSWPHTLDELARYRAPRRRPGPYDARRAAAGLADGRDDGRVRRFLESVWAKPKLSHAEGHALMDLCMAATYDPDPASPPGFRLPFNLESGELITARWRRWLAHDPVHLVRRYAGNLRSLRGIYIDCGWKDQYHMHYGSRVLSQRLAEAGVPHAYEEFEDNHSDIDYRLDVSLPFLYRALRPR